MKKKIISLCLACALPLSSCNFNHCWATDENYSNGPKSDVEQTEKVLSDLKEDFQKLKKDVISDVQKNEIIQLKKELENLKKETKIQQLQEKIERLEKENTKKSSLFRVIWRFFKSLLKAGLKITLVLILIIFILDLILATTVAYNSALLFSLLF